MRRELYLLFAIVVGISTVACWSANSANTSPVGPDAVASLVIYFKVGTSEAQVQSFRRVLLTKERADGRGESFIDGVGSYLRLTPNQANGHWAIAITFLADSTDEQRKSVRDSIASSDLVYKIFENVAPDKISEPQG